MKNDNLKFKDIFWNTLGTVTYAAVSLLLSIIVINISGKIEGGIFSFGFSTLAHFVFIISYFGIRPMHIVDVKYKYGFSEYVTFGRNTAFISLCLGTLYIVLLYKSGNYSFTKTLLLCILVLHGAIDGFADYFECEYQRVNRLYMCGQSLFFRITFFAITLIGILFLTKNLFYAETFAIVVEIIVFAILNPIRGEKVFKTVVQAETIDKKKNLFFEALPLFLIVFLDMFVFSVTKFGVDIYLGDTYNGFFNIIFMPTNVIYLVMNLFMKPILTPLSNAYFNDKILYKNIIIKTMFIAFVISFVFMVGTYFLGDIYINIVNYITEETYVEFLPFAKKILLIVIAGGCLYTINTPLYFSLIIENKQKYLMIAYFITCIISAIVANIFVLNLGVMGAAYGFLVNMFALCVCVFITKVICR